MTTTLPLYGSTLTGRIRKYTMTTLFSLLAMLMFAFSALGAGGQSLNVHRAEAFDWTRWVMCDLLPEPAADVYQYMNTDDIQFNLRSKSVASPGVQPIDSTLNSLLTINTEDDFVSVNEEVLGRTLRAEANESVEDLSPEELEARDKAAEEARELQKEMTSEGEETTSAVNGGEAVTPYERFGVSGLTFTGYLGEWKYLVVDACSVDSEPKDPKAGLMYDDRLEPQATWENRSNSRDIRVLQSTRGMFSQFSNAALNVMANGVFDITKIIVVITLAIIFLGFANVPEVMGLDQLLGGDGGIFDSLFNGVFSPLLFFAFLLTAFYVFYVGIVKRQYRDALGQFLISLGMMLLAFIASAIPMQFVSFPNNVSMVGQAAVVSAVGGSINNTKGICARTDTETEIVEDGFSLDVDILEEANKNIRSAIGCQFWEAFLLRPWSEAQFGDNYTKLWVNDNIPANAGETAEALGNDNEEMVGEATVPLGGGTKINNWAVFQISTLTDAHAQVQADIGENTRYTSGVSSDWWRVVDALANYDEENQADIVYDSERGNKTVQYNQQKLENVPSQYWSQWVGNNSANRIGIAASSVLVALVGVVVPLMFASLSAMYSIGLALMMSFAPFMFLLATWAKTGREYFMSWLSMVVNTVFKRIAVGLMLILTLVGTTTLLSMTEELSYWTILIAIIVLSIIMWKAKDKIISVLASFNFGSFDLATTASKVGESSKKMTVDAPLNFAASTSGAVVGAKYGGGTALGGLADGLKYEVRNLAWRNEHLRPVMTQYDITSKQEGQKDITDEYCISCNTKLEYDQKGNFKGGVTEKGLYLCERCYKDRIYPDATPVRVKDKEGKRQRQGWVERRTHSKNKKLQAMQEMHRKAFDKNNEYLANGGSTQSLFDTIENGSLTKNSNGETVRIELNDEQKEQVIKEISDSLRFDIDTFAQAKNEQEFDTSIIVPSPSTPAQLHGYVNENALQQAWHNKEYEYVSQMYAAGIIAWYKDNTNAELHINVNELAQAIMPKTVNREQY